MHAFDDARVFFSTSHMTYIVTSTHTGSVAADCSHTGSVCGLLTGETTTKCSSTTCMYSQRRTRRHQQKASTLRMFHSHWTHCLLCRNSSTKTMVCVCVRASNPAGGTLAPRRNSVGESRSDGRGVWAIMPHIVATKKSTTVCTTCTTYAQLSTRNAVATPGMTARAKRCIGEQVA